MATIEVVTKDRILALEAETVVSGSVNVDGDLILTKHGGTTVNAGHVVGPAGDPSAFLADAKAYTDQEVDKVSTSIGTADLDTILTPGRYVQTSDVEATAARHYPELRAGHLEVLGTNPGAWDMLLHRYTVYETGNPAVWVRTRYNQVWGGWKLAMKDAFAYRYNQTVLFESSGTFSKAAYPGLRAVKVRVVGGGGAGGGSQASGTGLHSSGGGGGGGGYAEGFVLESALAASETVTVGAGGSGSTGVAGSAGGASSFGAHVAAGGGNPGAVAAASGLMISATGGSGGVGTAGDILSHGGPGAMGSGYATLGQGAPGGNSTLGGGAPGTYSGAGSGSIEGQPGYTYGGGGGGATTNSGGIARPGGAGAPGVVIVEVYL